MANPAKKDADPSDSDSNCLDEDAILAFATGELDGRARRKALEHVDGCESCRRLAAALARDASFESKAARPEDDDEEDQEIGPTSVLTEGELVAGRFRLMTSLGRGAMGTVYRAHDTKLDMDVALKLLERDGVDRDAKAFARELKVGRRVTHPNVCRLHDAGKHEGLAYITMEIVEGDTLAELLARGPIAIDRALTILDGIASGLAAVHSEGIVHRDLKPANVMIERESGKAILTDFGFAADLEAKQSRRLVGTPSFWAPEQARGETPTPASDVFSFGVLAYRLLAGTEFSFSDPAMESIPRPYRAFIETCVQPRPSERYPSATAALSALRDAQQRRRFPILWAVGAAAALALGVVAIGSMQSKPMTTTPSPSSPPGPTTTQAPPSTPATTAPVPPATEEPRPLQAATTIAAPPLKTIKPNVMAPPTPPPPAASSAVRPPPAPSASSSDPLYRH